MFERFTEEARRSIFFARYEASIWGSTHIETSHFLLGLLREDKALFSKLIREQPAVETAAQEMGLKTTGNNVSVSVDLPLSQEMKRVLAYAAEEAENLNQQQVVPCHLLLGLLREPSPARDFLETRGLQPLAVREFLRNICSLSFSPLDKRISGEIRVHYRPSPNERIIADLRQQFDAMTTRLKPEMEPAVSFSLRTEKPQ